MPPHSRISRCADTPQSFAACSSASTTAGVQITERSITLTAGPLPSSTAIADFISGRSPVSVTSTAIAASGSTANAAAPAPRRPTSSCAVNTKYRSFSISLSASCSIISRSVTQPMRLSRYGPHSTPFCSNRGASYTAKSPICTSLRASSAFFAPMSMNRLSSVKSLSGVFSS